MSPTIPIPNDSEGEVMAASETIATVLDQTFADNHQARLHAGRRLTEANDNVSEQTKLGYLEEKIKVGTREAAAMQRMDNDKLANAILQQRSAKDQPQGTT